MATNNCSYVAIDIPGTCTASGFADIENIDDCRVAIDSLDEALGFDADHFAQDVSANSYSFRNAGCTSSCYSQFSGYFCNAFNSDSTGVRTSDDDDDHQICIVG
jgi:hypothetical protein